MNREAWHAAVHGVAKSWTLLSNWTELNLFVLLLFFLLVFILPFFFLYFFFDNCASFFKCSFQFSVALTTRLGVFSVRSFCLYVCSLYSFSIPFSFVLCGMWSLGASERSQAWTSDLGDSSPANWNTWKHSNHGIPIGESSPKDLHLNTKTKPPKGQQAPVLYALQQIFSKTGIQPSPLADRFPKAIPSPQTPQNIPLVVALPLRKTPSNSTHQNSYTFLHQKNFTGCWESAQEIPPMTRSWGEDLTSKPDQVFRDSEKLPPVFTLKMLSVFLMLASIEYSLISVTQAEGLPRSLSK